MVIWYIIGYFLIGLIISIADRVSDEFQFDKPYYKAEDPGTELIFHVMLVLLWPLALVVFSIIAIDARLSVLSKWLAKQIKERSEHEQTKSQDRHRG